MQFKQLSHDSLLVNHVSARRFSTSDIDRGQSKSTVFKDSLVGPSKATKTLRNSSTQNSPMDALTNKKEVKKASTPLEPPAHFVDMVSYEVMTDPVFCNDGFTYDRSTAQQLKKSPMTREDFKILGANIGLRSAIMDAFPELFVPRYEGDKDDKGTAHGRGILQACNGEKSEGLFRQGQFIEGVFTRKNGDVEKGSFLNNTLHGVGTKYHVNGNILHGTFKKGLLHGEGYWVFSDGRKVHATFKNGTAAGAGEVLLTSGQKYIGTFSSGKLNGPGRMVNSDGSEKKCYFEDGKAYPSIISMLFS